MDLESYYRILKHNDNFTRTGTNFKYLEREWFRGPQQRRRAIEDRINKYGADGIILSMSEFKSNGHMSCVFPNSHEIISFIRNIDTSHEKCFYELIENKSKLYFDIDLPAISKLTDEDILNNIYGFLEKYFHIKPSKAYILTAHRKDKKSWHIIFPEYFLSSEDRKNLGNYIAYDNIPGIDFRVYNKTQPLRIQGCCIRGRPDSILVGKQTLEETMVTIIPKDAKHLFIRPIQIV